MTMDADGLGVAAARVRWKGHSGRRLVALAVVGFLVLVGCGEAEEPADLSAWHARVDQMVRDLQDLGDEQLEMIAEARETGYISFEDYEVAVLRSIDCMNDSGIRAAVLGSRVFRGLPHIDVSYGGLSQAPDSDEDKEVDRIHDECRGRHSFALELLYQVQPFATELMDALVEEYMPALVDCLRRYGVEIEDDPPRAVWQQHVGDLLMGDSEAGDGPNCLEESGLVDAGLQ